MKECLVLFISLRLCELKLLVFEFSVRRIHLLSLGRISGHGMICNLRDMISKIGQNGAKRFLTQILFGTNTNPVWYQNQKQLQKCTTNHMSSHISKLIELLLNGSFECQLMIFSNFQRNFTKCHPRRH